MDAEKLIVSVLRNIPLKADVVAFSQIPQGHKLPFITYQRISSTPTDTLCAEIPAEYVLMQIDCFATDYTAAIQLFKAVQLALINTGKADYVSRQDLAEDTGYYRVISEFRIFQEA